MEEFQDKLEIFCLMAIFAVSIGAIVQ